MPIPFEGGCHCGSVRYVCSEEPITVVNCHCGDCQKNCWLCIHNWCACA